MSIQIDDGIALPKFVGSAIGKFPFSQLKVGQSFFVPNRTSASMAGTVSAARKRTGFQFAIRARVENGVQGVRIWRRA